MLTFDEARKLYESHLMNRRKRLNKLMRYYKNEHDILNRKNRKNKKDAKVAHGYPRYISTIATGYTGSVNYSKIEQHQELQDIFNFNSESSVDSDLLLFMSIFGEAYEIDWIDEQNNYCFEALDPRCVMVITDGKIRESVTDAIVFDEDDLPNNKVKVTLTCYDDTNKKVYSYVRTDTAFKSKNLNDVAVSSFTIEQEEMPHMIDGCPIIQYKNNRWNIGDFEPVISEIDAYNLSVSNSVNDLTDNTDALMIFRNLDATTQEDLNKSIAAGGIKVRDNGDVSWLIKTINDSYAENIKNRLDKDIHKHSFIPNMSDEQFASNASGVAIRYKLLALEQLRLEKIKWMKKGLLKRLTFICNYLSLMKQITINPLDVGIVFKENLPKNSQEIVDFVSKLNGITSKTTMLTQLGQDIVPDVKAELKAIQDEQEEQFNNGFIPTPSEVVDDDQEGLLGASASTATARSIHGQRKENSKLSERV